jgi:hypothetical protein
MPRSTVIMPDGEDPGNHVARLAIEKAGIRKLIHQIPWYKDGIFSGVVELSFVLPEALPHFVRDPG